MTRTVSVELTDAELRLIRQQLIMTSDDHLRSKLSDAHLRLGADQEREAKVQALKDNVAIPRGYDHWVALECLNAAGWDLVRIEKEAD
jgi:hypothetical protein